MGKTMLHVASDVYITRMIRIMTIFYNIEVLGFLEDDIVKNSKKALIKTVIRYTDTYLINPRPNALKIGVGDYKFTVVQAPTQVAYEH